MTSGLKSLHIGRQSKILLHADIDRGKRFIIESSGVVDGNPLYLPTPLIGIIAKHIRTHVDTFVFTTVHHYPRTRRIHVVIVNADAVGKDIMQDDLGLLFQNLFPLQFLSLKAMGSPIFGNEYPRPSWIRLHWRWP